MTNAGQTCAGVERVYVERAVYPEFTAKVVERASRVRAGEQYGPITMPSQLQVIARHIGDALDRGGRALVGGRDSVQPPYVAPVVLTDVPADSAAVTDETFGPVLVLTEVGDVDEAVATANAGRYGLGASVFSRHQGSAIARRLDAGMVSINSVLSYAAVPGLPWGGSKDSGFGRIHGPDGLREFARSRAITSQRLPNPLRLSTFEQSRNAVGRLKQVARLRWQGRGTGM
jgi:acyl-CoA reductase-like NAD-dependent aldehyde dehydrogenase